MPDWSTISLREARGTAVRNPPLQDPDGFLARSTALLLLIHGFNNTPEEATQRYEAFRALLDAPGAPITPVHWPGSNWAGPGFYMSSIGNAEDSARALAAALRTAAEGRPFLRVSIVAHSMGCRLAMELAREILEGPPSTVVIERVALMAGAVPIRLLKPGAWLRPVLTRQPQTLSHYSSNDGVLKRWFRIGETLAGEGFWPVALGAAFWSDPARETGATVSQRNAAGAGHSDYWGSERDTVAIARDAAVATRSFLYPYGAYPRELPSRTTDSRDTTQARNTAPGRTTPAR